MLILFLEKCRMGYKFGITNICRKERTACTASADGEDMKDDSTYSYWNNDLGTSVSKQFLKN